MRPECRRLAVVRDSLYVDRLTGLDRIDAPDREPLTTSQTERLRVLARSELERQYAHAHQVRPMDALEALGDHRAHTQQQRALGGPVARRARAVLLAGEDYQRHALSAVSLRGVVDRDLIATGEVARPVALTLDELVAEPD